MKKSTFCRIATATITLSILLLLLTGCGYRKQAEFESGYFGYTNNPKTIMLGVRSDKDTFSKDDITFDLYYGLHDIGYDKKHGTDPKSHYSTADCDSVIFGVFIGNIFNDDELSAGGESSDYKTFEHHYLLKEIPWEEADGYGFTMTYLTGITYNHHETITIPKECLAENESGIGFIRIKIIAFCGPMNEGDNYIATSSGVLDLRYKVIDENTIKIDF